MSEDKIYRAKTKDGAHINEKVKDDGSRAAIQFDEENGLQGPVDLIEVDESEFIREKVVPERSFGQVMLEDAVAPAISDALTILLTRAVSAGIDAFGSWISNKVLPAAKAKSEELIKKSRESRAAKKRKKDEQISTDVVLQKEKNDVSSSVNKDVNPVFHTQEEVEMILNNMKFAALYIAAGIRELSNTVVTGDNLDPEKALEMQMKLKELSSGEVMRTIEFMLEEKNSQILDQATIQLFDAFRHKDFIVNGKAVPISRYFETMIEE